MPDLLDRAPVGVMVIDKNGRYRMVNRTAGAQVRLPAAALVGEPLDGGPHGDPETAVRLRTCQERREAARLLVRVRKGPAEGAWLEWLVEPIEEGLLVISVPVGDGEAEMERIRRAERLGALGLLAGGVAHDLNNHLTVIRSLSSVLESSDLPPEVKDDVMGISQAAARAGDLIRRLLTYGRPQNDEPGIDPAVVVSGVLELVRRLVPPGVKLKVAAAPGQGLIRMDRSALEQVVMNLVLNARDALDGDGTIEVGVEVRDIGPGTSTPAGVDVPPGGYVVVTVRDTGRGIPADRIPKILDPFFTTKGLAGTGLGLATVHSLVRARGGYVTVQSVEGEGSTFAVLLPRPADGAPHA